MKKLQFIILILLIFVIGKNILAYPVNDKYSLNNSLIEQISSTVPNYTEIGKIPADLKNAVVAVEDRRFYEHYGVDVIGIGRAFIINIKEGEIKEGGSTITQQLVKNLFLQQDKSFSRKLKEAALALRLESMYDKDQILEMYLNVIYYGSGAYSVQDASRTYFQKDVWELSAAESAMLAGLPQAPSVYNPKENFAMAKKRQEAVLEAMAQSGYPPEEIKEILQDKIIIAN